MATYLRCGGFFSDSIITNFFLILTVKKFENLSIFDGVLRRTKSVPDFLAHPVYMWRGLRCQQRAWLKAKTSAQRYADITRSSSLAVFVKVLPVLTSTRVLVKVLNENASRKLLVSGSPYRF